MNRILLGVCGMQALIFITFMIGRAQSAIAPPAVQGRFQLYGAEYDYYAGNSSTTMSATRTKAIFRLDTETGATQELAVLVTNGTISSKWIEVKEK